MCETSDVDGLPAAVDGLDIVIVNPHPNNRANPYSNNGNGCWDGIQAVIRQYPGILFYLIDANAERRPFFDMIKLPNLVHVNGDEQKKFFENPAKYIIETYEAYRRTTSPSETT